MSMRKRWIGLAVGILAFGATAAAAQENLDRGKSGAQLYASNCAICHKSPRGLARAGGLFGVEHFLREHYTASRESAAAIGVYLKDVDRAPTASTRARPAKPAAKRHNSGKAGEARPQSKDVPSASAKSKDTTPSAPEKTEAKPAPERSGEAKPAEPKAADHKAEAPKSTEGAKPKAE